MAASELELRKCEAAARAEFHRAVGTPDDEFGATLFVSHHLEELDPSYWKKHLSTETPDQRRVLDLLVLKSHWSGDDELGTFDFTLPGEISDYVLSVTFDESGATAGMTMES